MTLYSEYLDDILIQCGGFGRYQIMLFTFIYMLGKICPAWTLLMMSVAGEMPVWSCSEKFEEKLVDMCVHGNGTRCTRFSYKDEHRTVVSQWNLVCDKAWITSFMTTIQMVGNLIGAFVGGHLSDAFGRKPALYLSIVLFTLFNFLAYISSSWQMFVVVRFVLGYACASFFVIYFPLLVEFMPAKQRAIISAFPSFTLWSALLGLIAWFFPDWDNLHIVTALSAVPMLFTWWIIPESFRWLITKNRIDEAENIIKDMARINGRRVPDTSKIRYLIGPEKETRHYTMRDLFREKSLATATILLSCIWNFSGYTYYTLSFGIQKLSGSLYLNVFLLSALELPGDTLTYYLNNRIGRKWTCAFFFFISGLAGLLASIIELLVIDNSTASTIIKILAFITRMGNSAGWCALAVLTTETYPTVIRNIGYSFSGTVGRLGAMISPTILYMTDFVPGLVFFLCGASMILAALCAIALEETRDKPLEDIIIEKCDKKK